MSLPEESMLKPTSASSRPRERWALVTGASSGIGRAFAMQLAGRGYSVLAVARRREGLEALAREVAVQGGVIEPVIADLQTEAGIAAFMRRVDEMRGIDLLVNNAGGAAPGGLSTRRTG